MAISNNELKRVRSLQQKKFRDESGLFVAEGEKMVNEALRSSFHVEAVYDRKEIGESAMKQMSSLSTPSPVLAVIRKPSEVETSDMEQIKSMMKNGGLYLALDAIRDPGNLGTIIRIADWFGIDAVFATRDTVDVFNPKVVQSTMGAIFRVKIYYVDFKELAAAVKDCDGKIYGTFLDGEDIYGKEIETGADAPSVIVIGNEAKGISPEVEAIVSDRLYIPPFPADTPGSESLNAAVATAIATAEFRRRIRR